MEAMFGRMLRQIGELFGRTAFWWRFKPGICQTVGTCERYLAVGPSQIRPLKGHWISATNGYVHSKLEFTSFKRYNKCFFNWISSKFRNKTRVHNVYIRIFQMICGVIARFSVLTKFLYRTWYVAEDRYIPLMFPYLNALHVFSSWTEVGHPCKTL